ncbi:hypothetical protein GCM10023329_31330 [Streptomyces sanyensis]|uniref:Uncharacterized protein n=1 Tax=Streptomyces sanyensis TaxID=568869 RepID=A0ABP9ADW5_9ACTN
MNRCPLTSQARICAPVNLVPRGGQSTDSPGLRRSRAARKGRTGRGSGRTGRGRGRAPCATEGAAAEGAAGVPGGRGRGTGPRDRSNRAAAPGAPRPVRGGAGAGRSGERAGSEADRHGRDSTGRAAGTPGAGPRPRGYVLRGQRHTPNTPERRMPAPLRRT